MKTHDDHSDELIDLGAASVETKGEGKIDQDPGGSQLRFVTGIAQD